MGLNLSNEQIAQEMDIDPDDAQVMASRLREGIVERKPEVQLGGEVECDEVYVVAGHKGHPEAVRKKGDSADAAGGAIHLRRDQAAACMVVVIACRSSWFQRP